MKFSKGIKTEKRNAVREAAADLLAGLIGKVKERIVQALQRWEKRYSHRQKKIMLLAFCILFGGYCLCLLTGVFSGNGIANLKLHRENGTPPLALPPPAVQADRLHGHKIQ